MNSIRTDEAICVERSDRLVATLVGEVGRNLTGLLREVDKMVIASYCIRTNPLTHSICEQTLETAPMH